MFVLQNTGEAVEVPERRSQVMRDRIAKRFEFLVGCIELRYFALQNHIEPLDFRKRFAAQRNIPYGRGYQCALFSFNWAQTDFDGELRTIFAPPVQIETGPHRSGARVLRVVMAMLRMDRSQSIRDQNLDRLANQFTALVAKKIFRLGVYQIYFSASADNYDRVGGSLQQAFETL